MVGAGDADRLLGVRRTVDVGDPDSLPGVIIFVHV